MGLSTRMPECFHNLAAGLPQSKQYKRAPDIQEHDRSRHVFMYNIAFHPTLQATNSPNSVWDRSMEGCEHQEAKNTDAILKASYHSRQMAFHMNGKMTWICLRGDHMHLFQIYHFKKWEHLFTLSGLPISREALKPLYNITLAFVGS